MINKKIAIQLTGQLRDWPAFYEQWKIIKKLTGADFYLATWDEGHNFDLSFFEKASIVECKIERGNAYKLADRWKRANELRQLTGIEYDAVFMVRPDAVLSETFIESLNNYLSDIKLLEEHILGVEGGMSVKQNGKLPRDPRHVNWFMEDKAFIGTPATIDTLSFIYNEMIRRVIDEVNHYNLPGHCFLHKIKVVDSKIKTKLRTNLTYEYTKSIN